MAVLMVAVYVIDTTCVRHNFLSLAVSGGGIVFGCKAAETYMLIFVCYGGTVVYCAVFFCALKAPGSDMAVLFSVNCILEAYL